MEQVVLSSIDLNLTEIKSGSIHVCRVTEKSVAAFNGRDNVAVVVGSRAMSRKVLQLNFPNLRMYQLTSAGFDHVPLQEYKALGVTVCNAGSVYSQPIAETVVYGILQFAKRYWDNPKHHYLRPLRNYKHIAELANKSAIILGCGNIGTEIAKRLCGFDMLIDGYDPYCQPKKEFRQIYRTRQELLFNLNKYQYVITTLPETNETANSLNSEFFRSMNCETVLVNVGRMAIFDEKSLLETLRKRKIRGAVLDMFEKIPNPLTNPFRRLPNVIVFPGVAAISQEVNTRLQQFVEANCQRVLDGLKPQCIIS